MKIIITGGSGFIGKYLSEDLSISNKVYILGRKKNKIDVEVNSGLRVPYFFTDYSIADLSRIFDEIKPDAVVHMAALRLQKDATLIPDYMNILILSANLFRVCLEKGITNIINISSKSVYSPELTIPWNENNLVSPENYYGLSKAWIETTASFFCKKGLNIKTLRLAQVIGIGEREGYVLQIFLENARRKIPIKVFGTDKGRRQYIYVKDVLRAIDICLMKPYLSGIFNIGMHKSHSFYELAYTINKVFNNKAGIIRLFDQGEDENNYLMDIEKAKKILNWEPVYDLELSYIDIKKTIITG